MFIESYKLRNLKANKLMADALMYLLMRLVSCIKTGFVSYQFNIKSAATDLRCYPSP